jgi:sporulation protein YlmC with PRC-barrel domain
MLSTEQIERLLAHGTVVTTTGDKIGKVGQVFLDDRTGEPEWVTVRTGLFGAAESFVPLAEADVEGDEVRVPFGKDVVKGAPRVDDAQGHLSREEEGELYRHYGRSSPDAGGPSGTAAQDDRTERDDRADAPGAVGKHAAGPSADDASARSDDDDARADATASGTGTAGTGTAGTVRLRRYVVTEYVTQGTADDQPGGGGAPSGEGPTVSKRVREEVVETGTDSPGPGTNPGEDERP